MHTLQEILALPIFTDLIVLNQQDFADRIVEDVDVTETPDIAQYTFKNGLILTTGMAFKDNQDGLIDFITSLNSINAAGLAIKTNRYLGTLEPHIIAYADALNFPLIEIPTSYTLGMLSHQILDYILGQQLNKIQYALDIQKHFSKLLMHNASLETIIDELSNTIKTQILLLDPFGHTLAHSKHFNRINNPTTFYEEQIHPMLYHNSPRLKKGTIYSLDHKLLEINLHPLNINPKFPHFLIVFNPQPLNYPISELAIDQAILILTFAIYKTEQLENYMIGVQTSFFKNTLIETTHITQDFFKQALPYGIIQSNSYQVAVYGLGDGETIVEQEAIARISYQWINNNLLPKLPYGLAFYNQNDYKVYLLIQESCDTFLELLNSSIQELNRILNLAIKVGVGQRAEAITGIRDSFLEAVKSQEQAQNNHVLAFKPSGMMTLFDASQTDAIKYYIRKTLLDLAFTDDTTLVEYRETLRVYLDSQCEITKTAEILFLHRNTVSYRIKKIEDLLGVNVKEADVNLNLRLALQLHENFTMDL